MSRSGFPENEMPGAWGGLGNGREGRPAGKALGEGWAGPWGSPCQRRPAGLLGKQASLDLSPPVSGSSPCDVLP